MTTEFHTPVLLKETISWLDLKPNFNVIDGTIGGGGHAEAILEKTAPQGQLIGCDLDPKAIAAAKKRLARFGRRVHLFQTNFVNLPRIHHEQFRNLPISAFLLDLGVSSFELGDETRGFSFLKPEAPLDMRMSGEGLTAADILNTYPENELTKILSEYGQENHTRQIAKEILLFRQKQKFSKVGDLTAAILRVYINKLHSHKPKPWVGGTHPATKTFQALRLAVNRELSNLPKGLEGALSILKTGGRLAVISFHSLEDKIVKDFFQRESRKCICPPEIPVCQCHHRASLKRLTKKGVTAGAVERRENPRSRSAHLRVAEKI
ncbi:MAG: 16S rRNA (cytosine(1402)-N(4))-methyltransferase RsmH [Patescibacteria group bacterium]|nr:16S rRNA (cytosine(1402)-N(4))-methyltransferase RsmH [Patescibacteria group bacterium]